MGKLNLEMVTIEGREKSRGGWDERSRVLSNGESLVMEGIEEEEINGEKKEVITMEWLRREKW